MYICCVCTIYIYIWENKSYANLNEKNTQEDGELGFSKTFLIQQIQAQYNKK